MAGTDRRSAAGSGRASSRSITARRAAASRSRIRAARSRRRSSAVVRPNTRKGFNRLLAAIRAQEPACVVVGLPLSLSGARLRADDGGARVRRAPARDPRPARRALRRALHDGARAAASRDRGGGLARRGGAAGGLAGRPRLTADHAPQRSRSAGIWAIKGTTAPLFARPGMDLSTPTPPPGTHIAAHSAAAGGRRGRSCRTIRSMSCSSRSSAAGSSSPTARA